MLEGSKQLAVGSKLEVPANRQLLAAHKKS